MESYGIIRYFHFLAQGLQLSDAVDVVEFAMGTESLNSLGAMYGAKAVAFIATSVLLSLFR